MSKTSTSNEPSRLKIVNGHVLTEKLVVYLPAVGGERNCLPRLSIVTVDKIPFIPMADSHKPGHGESEMSHLDVGVISDRHEPGGPLFW